MVEIRDVAALGLKVAKIKEVSGHPNADRLYVLKVDLGGEERQLVAGLKQAYPEPRDLIGKLIVVVTNLKPAVLRGVESQGMLLAAAGDDNICILSPECEVNPGSEVR